MVVAVVLLLAAIAQRRRGVFVQAMSPCVCSVYVQVVSCLTAGVHLTFVNVLCALWYPICVVFFVWFSR